MESARGSYPDSYGPAAAPLFRPPVKFHLHRPFEDHVIRRSTDPSASSFSVPAASYLQYPDVHSTGFPLLLPPPPFQPHPLGAFQQLYQQQKMRAEASQAAKDELEFMKTRIESRHDDSRGEEDDRSRSPDSPTQLTGDEGANDDVDADDSESSHSNYHTSSPAANKCESLCSLFHVPL